MFFGPEKVTQIPHSLIMPGYHICIQSRAALKIPSMPLTGGAKNCGQGRELPRRLIQGIQGGHSGQPLVSHRIQHGDICGDMPLGDGSGGDKIQEQRGLVGRCRTWPHYYMRILN